MSTSTVYRKKICAACKEMHVKCDENCIARPYFPSDQPYKFRAIISLYNGKPRIFIDKLKLISVENRQEFVNSMLLEAVHRFKDPVLGTFASVDGIKERLNNIEKEVSLCRKEVSKWVEIPDEAEIARLYDADARNKKPVVDVEVPLVIEKHPSTKRPRTESVTQQDILSYSQGLNVVSDQGFGGDVQQQQMVPYSVYDQGLGGIVAAPHQQQQMESNVQQQQMPYGAVYDQWLGGAAPHQHQHGTFGMNVQQQQITSGGYGNYNQGFSGVGNFGHQQVENMGQNLPQPQQMSGSGVYGQQNMFLYTSVGYQGGFGSGSGGVFTSDGYGAGYATQPENIGSHFQQQSGSSGGEFASDGYGAGYATQLENMGSNVQQQQQISGSSGGEFASDGYGAGYATGGGYQQQQQHIGTQIAISQSYVTTTTVYASTNRFENTGGDGGQYQE